MFKSIFSFELSYRLRQPMVYVFFLINFFLVFSATVSEEVTIGESSGAQYLNAPFTIMSLSGLMTILGIFMTAAFMTTAILRDFTHQYDGILFSTPIKKSGYLGGRFLGAFLMALVPFLGVFAGIALGSVTPWVDEG
ncbi:MAG: hypothetical protein AAF985_20065, partial [Bacteroidota bacterium]